MSLDNIQLSPIVIAGLFKKSLVGLNDTQQPSNLLEKNTLNFLGANEKKTIVIVHHPEAAFLPDKQLTLLLEIMQACKFTMQDFALINAAHSHSLSYTHLASHPGFDKMLLFGIPTEQVAVPMNIPQYQVQHFGGKTYLTAPSLTVLENNREEKKELWMALKKMFAI